MTAPRFKSRERTPTHQHRGTTPATRSIEKTQHHTDTQDGRRPTIAPARSAHTPYRPAQNTPNTKQIRMIQTPTGSRELTKTRQQRRSKNPVRASTNEAPVTDL